MNVSKKLLLFLGCLVLLLSFSPIRHVAAQGTGPWVYFSPDPSYIYIDGTNQVTVDIMVREVVDINAFDIKVNFDPNIVSMVSYEFGGFLKSVACTNEFIQPESLRLVCTQLGEQGQSGTGSLFRITFRGVTEGISELEITKVNLIKWNGYLYTPGKTDGTLNVVDSTNYQYLPLIMNVSAQGAQNRGGIGVALANGSNYGMGPYSGTSLNQSGSNLTIASVLTDSYRITTNHARVLNITSALNKTFTLAPGANTVPALRLVAGNAVWTDNVINLNDWTAVCGALGNPSQNADADVNFDGLVDARDLALVAGNWGLTSAVAYVAWLP